MKYLKVIILSLVRMRSAVQSCSRAPQRIKGHTEKSASPFFVSDFHTRSHRGPLTALHQRRGQAPSTGSFSDRILNNSSAISAAQNAHSQAVVFEVAEAIYTILSKNFRHNRHYVPQSSSTDCSLSLCLLAVIALLNKCILNKFEA